MSTASQEWTCARDEIVLSDTHPAHEEGIRTYVAGGCGHAARYTCKDEEHVDARGTRWYAWRCTHEPLHFEVTVPKQPPRKRETLEIEIANSVQHATNPPTGTFGSKGCFPSSSCGPASFAVYGLGVGARVDVIARASWRRFVFRALVGARYDHYFDGSSDTGGNANKLALEAGVGVELHGLELRLAAGPGFIALSNVFGPFTMFHFGVTLAVRVVDGVTLGVFYERDVGANATLHYQFWSDSNQSFDTNVVGLELGYRFAVY